jgi:hypothetical protein
MAVETITHTVTEKKFFDGQVEHNVEIHKLACVADSTDGSFSLAVTIPLFGVIYQFIHDPGSPAPTASFDAVLTHPDHGYDIAGGALTDLHTSNTEMYMPEDGATNILPRGVLVEGILPTLTWANQAVNSAKADLYIYLLKGII